MDIVIVGSLAIDKIHTPDGCKEDLLGGSALYSGICASKFCETGVVGVIGEDKAKVFTDFLSANQVDISGIEVKSGKTFSWEGKYFDDINKRETLSLDLGVFADFMPSLPEKYLSPKVLFLANIDPDLQHHLIEITTPKFIALDTMDHWIMTKRDSLFSILPRIDLLIVNDDEARLMSQTRNLIKAGNLLLESMKENAAVIIKKGEHGAVCFCRDKLHMCPAYPLENPVDPTGAGDSFAGALLGYWVANEMDWAKLAEAMYVASVVASFCVEDFGSRRLAQIDESQIKQRVDKLYAIVCRRWDSNPHV